MPFLSEEEVDQVAKGIVISITIMFAVCIGGLIATCAPAKTAECNSHWCPQMMCKESADCGPGCNCLMEAREQWGRCVSFNGSEK